MAAARAEHGRRVAAGFLAPTESGKRRVSRLKISTGLQAKNAPTREPAKAVDNKKSRDLLTCKERPDPKKNRRTIGGGSGTKKFVPWCS
nr:MAG: hypothetical protein [Microvirus sp.]